MAMFAAYEENKPVWIRAKSGIGYVIDVENMTYNMQTKERKFKVNFIMRSRRKKPAIAKATHFNKEAAIKTSKQMDEFYAKNAEYQFKKALR